MMKLQSLLFMSICTLAVSNWAAGQSLTLRLDDFLQQVQEQSPDIQIQKLTTDETKAQAQGIRLNPPMVGVMRMQDAGGRNQGLEISQEIPFPTKIPKEKQVREFEARAQESGSWYRQREILLEARKAYFDFWRAYKKLQIVKERSEFLKTHAKIVRATTRSDSSTQAHLLGIESEIDLLENETLETQADLIEKRNRLQLFAPQLKVSDLIPSESKKETLQFHDPAKNPLVTWKESELKAAEATKDLSNQASLPDLYLRYRNFNGNEMTPQNEEIMVGITLPFLFFWQPQAESAQAQAQFQRAQAELQKVKLESTSQLSSLREKIRTLEAQLETLNEKLIPRAQKRKRLVENLSRRTMEGLNEHRTVALDYLDLKMKAIDIRVQYENAYAEILKLISNEASP